MIGKASSTITRFRAVEYVQVICSGLGYGGAPLGSEPVILGRVVVVVVGRKVETMRSSIDL